MFPIWKDGRRLYNIKMKQETGYCGALASCYSVAPSLLGLARAGIQKHWF